MYKLKTDKDNNLLDVIQRLSDNSFIPFDPANTCYQQYLKWISEGNTPLPPDEPTLS
jgi:hypothetical protein